jgi:hypothetical protein
MPVDKGEKCFRYKNFLNPSKQNSEKAITISQSNIHCHTTTKYHLNPSMIVKFQSERDKMEKRKLTSIKQDFIKSDTSKPE